MNRGIAAVTPIAGVLEVLDADTMKMQRRQDADRAKTRAAPLNSAFPEDLRPK